MAAIQDFSQVLAYLNKVFPELQARIDEAGEQVCYQTSDGEQCEPINAWIMSICALNGICSEIAQNYEAEVLKAAFFDTFGNIREENLRKLIKYLALSYSMLNDDRLTAFYDQIDRENQNAGGKDIDIQTGSGTIKMSALKKETPNYRKYMSYGWRVPNFLTPDQCFDTEDKGKLGRKLEQASFDNYEQAIRTSIQKALTKSKSQEAEAEINEYAAYISYISVFDNNDDISAIISMLKSRYKCNIYVGDVLFAALAILLKANYPEDFPDNEVLSQKVHATMKSTGLVSSNGRMQQTNALYANCRSLAGSTDTNVKDYQASQLPKTVEQCLQTIDTDLEYGYLYFLQNALTIKNCGRSKGDLLAEAQWKAIWAKNNIHHVGIYCGTADQGKTFQGISAHNFDTDIDSYTSTASYNKITYVETDTGIGHTGDTAIGFVKIVPILENLLAYYEKHR